MAHVTICIPVYNAMPYLPAAVESILRQTYTDFRFLIINDGSTDGSGDYLKTIVDPRVIVIHQENQGLGATLNRSLELCGTEFYARMDADDLCHPDRLRLQVGFMTKRPDVVLCGTQVSFFSGLQHFRGPEKPRFDQEIKSRLLRGVYSLCHASLLFRTSAARRIGGYRIAGSGQDLDFFLRMSDTGQLANLKDVLYHIRLQPESVNMTKQADVARGRAYALRCARCRLAGTGEPSYSDFCEMWPARNIAAKVLGAIDTWSTVQYRRALMDLASERKWRGNVRMVVAATCRPRGVARRVASRILGGQRKHRYNEVGHDHH